MATWNEIRSLAADLQRVQLGTAKQRLTERNCIEIVQRLSEMGLIRLIYTCDGKNFLTEAELDKEIYEELELNSFRVNIVALQTAINVDLSQVELRIREIMKSDSHLHLINGELIHETYFRRIATEIDETLYERGCVTVGELTKYYNFGTQTMLHIVNEYINKVINAKLDNNTLYTSSYLRRYRALIRGYFSAVLKPVSLITVANNLKLPESYVRTVLDELLSEGRVNGIYQSGRSAFAPNCFLRAQESWLKQFFLQNDYIELETIKKNGVSSDIKSYLKKLIGEDRVVFLKSCAVSRTLISSLESCLEGVRWLDLTQMLPSPLTDSDIDTLVSPLLRSRSDLSLIAGHYVISNKWSADLLESFNPMLNERAELLLKADPSLASGDMGSSKVTSRAAAADEAAGEKDKSGAVGKIKSGGGTQGREIKVKSTKNKYVRGSNKSAPKEASSPDSKQDCTLSAKDFSRHVRHVIEQQYNDSAEVCDDFLDNLYDILAPTLNKSLQQKLASVLTADSANKKQAGVACQNKIATLVRQMRLFEKGALALADTELQTVLFKHLLKSLGVAVLASFLEFIAISNGMEEQYSAPEISNLSPEQRQKVISQLPQCEEKDWLTLLNLALNGDSLEKVHQHIERLADKLGFMFKQLDKKAEKSLCAETAAQLVETLSSDCDSEMALLITVSLLVQACTSLPVHAPGRAVPMLISYLHGKLKSDASYQLLLSAQELVVRKAKRDSTVSTDIEETFPKILELGKSWKAAVATKK